jgi:serine protease Do
MFMNLLNLIPTLRRRKLNFVALCSALLLSNLPAAEPDIRRDATVDAVRSVMPSVVNIRTETIVENRDPYEDFFRQFFDPYHRRQQPDAQLSIGSGVIIDEDGYILTNLHVVRRARRIQIKLSDEAGGGEYEVQSVEATLLTDVALLKIIPKKPGEKFRAVKLAKDDDLLLGETVIALGDPFGLGGSVSRGILSAKRRAVPKENETLDVPNWIQTDAAINPGNSGGPLINLRGELIGLNVAILAQAQGIGFAIPIKQVNEALSQIFTPETAAIWFGARFSPGLAPIAIASVEKNSPAEQAGLRAGDQILQVNGKAPKNIIELSQWLRDKTQQNFRFNVQRGNQRQTFSVRLVPFPQLIRQKLGLDAQEIHEDIAANFGLAPSAGLLITGVEKNGPAEHAHLSPGFVIAQINGRNAPDFLNVISLLGGLKKGENANLTVLVPQRRGNLLVGYGTATTKLKAR